MSNEILRDKKIGFDTQLAHAGHSTTKDPFGSHIMPLYQTSTFVFDNVESGSKLFAGEEGGATHTYTRIGNPTNDTLEEIIARLEGWDFDNPDQCKALIFGSGMAAITTGIMGLAAGGRIISQETLYGCTSEFLSEQAPELGVEVTYVDGKNTDAFRLALEQHPDTKLVYLESIANPTLDIVDIQAISEMAHHHGAYVMVDNTFATPYHLRPLSLGADLVVHSTTKYLNGHGTVIGGVLIAKYPKLIDGKIKKWRKNVGGIASPFDSWLTIMGIKTFGLRMKRHAENAQIIAEYLERHPMIERVYYPGLESHPQHQLAKRILQNGYGGVVTFELKGGMEAGIHLMDHVRLCSLAVSLGHIDTLIEHPASMTHKSVRQEIRQEAGITDGLVRLAVGIENPEDIIEDLEQAMF